ncbi:hypothetical protein N658DRAFT_561733 [Parathielavia hyrcaniae]|uniref:Uncharacterized protein n=1 Tax=Parathielavia hyrcaniae TaxID=113614 RepID=A0AAN6SYF8_9PEZI|nr:hypothetical protein N658DRAFT_561733 [Parathielavia hyrcaniae]
MVESTPARDHLRSASPDVDERPPPIHGLAIETVAQILACFDSASLLSAIRAHPLFHATFQGFQQPILREILLRLEVPVQLLPLAFATYEAASMDCSDWNLIRRLLNRVHVGQGQASSPSPPPLTLRMVAAMERVHLMVGYFSADFARQARPRFNRLFDITSLRTATGSPSEELRILRAFYRFQLYCTIFGRAALKTARQAKSPEDVQRELQYFFWPWPPWVNEQLACVLDCLGNVISVFFDDVASHDVEWGWRNVDWVEPNLAIPHRRFLLYNGFELPFQLSQSDEFETWKTLLESADVCPNWPGDECPGTLANSLTNSVAPISATDAEEFPSRLGMYDTDELRRLGGPAAWEGIGDAETLPVDMWKFANENDSPRVSVFGPPNLLLRDAGYVFWDGYVGDIPEVWERLE